MLIVLKKMKRNNLGIENIKKKKREFQTVLESCPLKWVCYKAVLWIIIHFFWLVNIQCLDFQ